MPPTLTPQQFVHKWRQSELKERSASQQHFCDLCHLLGHPLPAEADPTGESFTFEAGATKVTGGEGWADVWKKGYFAWEYKGKHKDLDAAYQQLLLYRESLQNPPLLVVSDMDRIVIHTNFTNTVKRVDELALDDLLVPKSLDRLRAVFYNPQAFQVATTPHQVTQHAAEQFAKLADLLRRYGEDPERTAHFLIRLLFCLFAEDIRLLPEGLFTKLIAQTRRRPESFSTLLGQLFGAMATGGWLGLEEIRHFDGGLFDDAEVLSLDSEGLDILASVADLDWASIEPSILGTLFERGLDPSKRAQLGAHYTSRDDILLIVEPVLMAPLRRRWQEVQEKAHELAERRDQAKSQSARTQRTNELRQLLEGFARELAEVQVLDPACGSGNFLYVALRQLLNLWKEVSVLGSELGLPLMLHLPGYAPSPHQLHGIEINPYAHELAQATIWIGYLQWLHENGYGNPSEPILQPLEAVIEMDAVLAYDEAGNAVEPAWPRADVIIGNPPFLGGSKIRSELGDEYTDDLHALYSSRLPRACDLVCYWFERCGQMIRDGSVQRAGLLATQGIRGGDNRTVLERIAGHGGIFWAYSDRDWILDGATVHVSTVGFDDGTENHKELDGVAVMSINTDLTSSTDLTQAQMLTENLGICFRPDEKGGPFEIRPEIAATFLDAPANVNGRPNSDVLRRWVNGADLTGRSRDMWIIDFGADADLASASQYELPFAYAESRVKPLRARSRDARLRERWWLHRRPGTDMREALEGLRRYIATPRVAKYRLFVWLSPDILADCALYAFARDDDYFFGVLHARPHELWARRQGTQLREATSGSRYTPTSTFETYPFPWPPGGEPVDDPRVQAIAQAAMELVEKRDAWLNPPGASEKDLKKRTLTNLYNQRPTWLDLAHQKLDVAVFDAYGWPHALEDEEVLERLLTLNLTRAGGGGVMHEAG